MTSGKLKSRLIGEGYNNTTGDRTIEHPLQQLATFLQIISGKKSFGTFHACYFQHLQQTNKLRGLSPRANYTDRATAACQRS
jgi:hypothetical protein